MTDKRRVRDACAYCNKPADGPMLSMGEMNAHADCVVRALRELLDPDWEPGCDRKPLLLPASFLADVEVTP